MSRFYGSVCIIIKVD